MYSRLPVSDDDFLNGMARNGGSALAYAAEIGCSESAIYGRTRVVAARRGLTVADICVRSRRPLRPKGKLVERMAALEVELAAVRTTLTAIRASIDVLIARPAVVQEWRPDHRRIKDGGESVRTQRRRMASAS